jgi:hypothetical protein
MIWYGILLAQERGGFQSGDQVGDLACVHYGWMGFCFSLLLSFSKFSTLGVVDTSTYARC